MADTPTDRETVKALANEMTAYGKMREDILPMRAATTLRRLVRQLDTAEDQRDETIAALSEEGRKRGKAEAERDEAVALLRRWVAWCDGPALPHPLDDVEAAKAFLARTQKPAEGSAE